MPSEIDQVVARCESILAQCIVAANQAAAAAASIGAAGLAPLQSPAFTGNPTAPTPPAGDASASIATTAWIGAQLAQPNGIATLGVNGVVPLDQLPFAGLTSKGVWNAATNTPTLSAGTAGNTNGDFYIVTVSGSTNLDGITTWNVGDWALFSAGLWSRVPYTAPPISNLPLSSLESIGTGRMVANTSGGSAAPSAILISSIMGYLGVVTTGGSGLCPTLSGGTGTFLRGDGAWQTISAPDLSAYALLNSPAFTGTATVTTQARTTMSSAIASTQFIFNQLAGTGEVGLIAMNSVAASGTAPYLARIDHVHATDNTRAAASNPTLSGSAGSYNGTMTMGPRTTLSGTTTITGTLNGTLTGTLNGTLTFNGTATINGPLATGALTPSSVVGAVVAEGNLAFTDVTTNDASTSKHGLLRKLNNVATNFLDGQGNWTTPAGSGLQTASQGLTTSGSDVRMNTNNTLGVGSYALMQKSSAGTVASGATVSGSVLLTTHFGTDGIIVGDSTPSGTWRNMGGDVGQDQSGLFMRTA